MIGKETARLVARMESKLNVNSDTLVHQATSGVEKIVYELHLRLAAIERALDDDQ